MQLFGALFLRVIVDITTIIQWGKKRRKEQKQKNKNYALIYCASAIQTIVFHKSSKLMVNILILLFISFVWGSLVSIYFAVCPVVHGEKRWFSYWNVCMDFCQTAVCLAIWKKSMLLEQMCAVIVLWMASSKKITQTRLFYFCTKNDVARIYWNYENIEIFVIF